MPSGVPPRKGDPIVKVLQDAQTDEEVARGTLTGHERRKQDWLLGRQQCWRCGEVGHAKKKLSRLRGGCSEWGRRNEVRQFGPCTGDHLVPIGDAADPFSAWVNALRGAVVSSATSCRLDAPLTRAGDADDFAVSDDSVVEEEHVASHEKVDWCHGRKCSWVLATRHKVGRLQ